MPAPQQRPKSDHLTIFHAIYIRAPSAARKAQHQTHTNTNHPEQQTLDYSTVNIEKKPDSSTYLYFFSIYLPCRILLHPRLTIFQKNVEEWAQDHQIRVAALEQWLAWAQEEIWKVAVHISKKFENF